MKGILIVIVASAIGFFGCTQKKEHSQQVIIAGNLKGYEAKEIRFWWVGDSMKTTSIEEGEFKISFDAEETKTYALSVVPSVRYNMNDPAWKIQAMRSRFSLFLSPGDSTYLSADFNDFSDSFKIEGDHSAENTYLFEKRVHDNLSTDFRGGFVDWWPFMGLDNAQYVNKKDSLFNASRRRFEALKTAGDIDPVFVELEEAYFQYEPLKMDLQYPLMEVVERKQLRELGESGEYYTLVENFGSLVIGIKTERFVRNLAMYQLIEDSTDLFAEKINADLANLDLTRSELLSSKPYISLIEARISDAARDIMQQDTTLKKNDKGYEKAMVMAMDQLLSNQVVKDRFRFDFIMSGLWRKGPVYVKAEYDTFMDEQQSPKLAAKLKEEHDKWNPILPGKQVPDFTFVTSDGDPAKLSDLRGNLVYVDIWATWCGPCIAEHPYWDKLMDEYKDEPVAFLTLSLDDDKEAWEKMVKDKNMKGFQWYTDDAFDSEFAQHFIVRGIPRFLLLDKEGKVIDPSADKPSGDIRAALDQHLKI